MIRHVKSATVRTARLGLLTMLAPGLLLGAAQLILPFADLLRAQVEERLSGMLGLQVEVEHFAMSLSGLVPQLSLRGARLVDPQSGRTQLSLARLDIGLDLVASLRARSPQIDSVTLVGAHLVAKRAAGRGFAIAGLEGMRGGDPAAMTFFLRSGRFRLSQSDLQVRAEGSEKPVLLLTGVRMRFDNARGRHRVGLRAQLFGEPQSSLQLIGDLRGAAEDPAAWEGTVYLHWKGRDIGAIAGRTLPADLRLQSAGFALESWSDWQAGAVREATGRIRLTGLAARVGADHQPGRALKLDAANGLLHWVASDGGWRLDASSLVLARAGARPPPTDFSLRYRADARGRVLSGRVSTLAIATGGDLIRALPDVDPALTAWLGHASPEGLLRDVGFRVAMLPGGQPRWALAGRMVDLGFAPYRRLPGVHGISAEIAVTDSHGRAAIRCERPSFRLPRLFRWPLAADRLAGELRWARSPGGGWQIEAPEILAENADISTRSRLAISLLADGGDPLLDIQTEFRDGDAAAVRRYLPTGELKPDLVHWLDHAFVSGHVPWGTFIFRGRPADFPFRGNEGRFEVLFGVEDGILDYEPDWPRIEEIVGEVRFENQGLEVDLSDARFLASEVQHVNARIPDLFHAHTVQVAGTVQGPFADGLRTLSDTPLNARFGALARGLRAEGQSRLDLEMAIPLGSESRLALDGTLSWPAAARLELPDWDLSLTGLAGSLSFTDQALSADDLRARIWDVPVRIGIDTTGGGNAETGVTHVRLRAPLDTRLLAQRFPSAVWDLVQGQTTWEVALGIRRADLAQEPLPLNFALNSSLEGVAVALPEPLGKASGERKPLRLEGRLARGEPTRVKGSYGDLGLNLGFERGATGELLLAHGAFDLSGAVKPLPEDRGLHLSGSLPRLDLGAWINWWREPSSGQPAVASPGPPLLGADVRIEHLVLDDIALSALEVKAQRGAGGWEIDLNSPDLAGSVSIPDRARRTPVQVRLDRLDLRPFFSDRAPAGEALRAAAKDTDPRTAATFDVSVDRLLWGSNLLGTVAIGTEPRADGPAFDQLSVTGPLITVAGNGSWTRGGAGDATALSMDVSGPDLGELLRNLDFARVLEKAPAKASLDLAWPGSPWQFSLAHMKGRLTARIGAGSLLEIEPGVGRVFGILNLGALRRRLALDFSDIFERGYGFETIKGGLTFEDGKALIDRLAIKGPAASIDISGTTDLIAERFDQKVTVTPRIAPGVAVASAVAGGPLVGAAVYLADRVSNGAVDRLASYQYRITGPWNDPEIERTSAILGGHSATRPAPESESGDKAETAPAKNDEPPPRKNLFLDSN
jgi:uncharacterized protein (TIGR02099 family)